MPVDASGGQSTNAAFRAFVDRYAPAITDWMAEQHRSLNKVHSQISHGARLVVSDMEVRGLPHPKRWHEEGLLDHATAVCSTAIINRLLTRRTAPAFRQAGRCSPSSGLRPATEEFVIQVALQPDHLRGTVEGLIFY